MDNCEFGRATWLWVVFLIVASIAFSLGFACAVPLAAFGALAAFTLKWRSALVLAGGVWLANQAVGFVFQGYPHDGPTIAWGLILGAAAALCTLAPRPIVGRLRQRPMAAMAASFLCAFAVYEGGLYLVSAAVMGGAELYTAPVVLRILAINAAAFVALAALERLAQSRHLVPRPSEA